MRLSAKELCKYGVRATDGELGRVEDVYFDDRDWVVRYVVLDTRRWLPGRHVLIPKESLRAAITKDGVLSVDLTRAEIEAGPGVDSDPPLHQDLQQKFWASYVWTVHPWGGFVGAVPTAPQPDVEPSRVVAPSATHVRSVNEIRGYRIEASDGPIGHVEDFLLGEHDWRVHELVIDTRDWLPGKKVAVSTSDLEDIDWAASSVRVKLTRAEVEQSAEVVRAASRTVD